MVLFHLQMIPLNQLLSEFFEMLGLPNVLYWQIRCAFSPSSYPDAQALIQGTDENCTGVPLHRVHLSLVLSGSVVVGLRSSLPFKGVQLLLLNYLAGDKVVNPANTNVPALDQPHNTLEKVLCLLSPLCIINQTMDKKVLHQCNSTNMGITMCLHG